MSTVMVRSYINFGITQLLLVHFGSMTTISTFERVELF
ncbi:hypothetical protein PCIT_a4504 [Pseudoalteromonas citrea]|uniref:Uncharacterized protein n=1 Tax=Pseudoalteromonas citrea TaxID=43655 RepID=A0AAD4AG07_9GAMM|nr:hypothetical protein PCIT_a4504 [Pseudoalteromonas citrea]